MFSKVTAKNIFSWESLDYDFLSGVSQITGWNHDDQTPEGSGKSSIPNILCWTLYGEVPKPINIDDVIREGQKSCEAEVTFDNGWKVCRSRKPNKLHLETPEGGKVYGKDAKETQKHINTLVGLSFESFCQTVYFAQNYDKRFVTASEVEKTKILSEIQDLEIFDIARKEAQNRLRQLELEEAKKKGELQTAIARAGAAQDKASDVARALSDFQKSKARRESELRLTLMTRLGELQDFPAVETEEDRAKMEAAVQELDSVIEQMHGDIATLKAQLADHDRQVQAYDRLVASTKRLEKDGIDYAREAERAQIETEKTQTEISKALSGGKECPTCGEPLSSEKYAKHVEPHLRSLRSRLSSAEQTYASFVEKLSSVHEELERSKATLQTAERPADPEELRQLLEVHNSELRDTKLEAKSGREALANARALRQDLARLESDIVTLEEKLQRVSEETSSFSEEDLTEAHAKVETTLHIVEELGQALEDIRETAATYEVLKQGFKEVKQYVFQSLLEELSRKTTDYAARLFEQPVAIKFSNEGDEGGVSRISTVVTLEGQERTLGLFSGGQLKRIQMSVDLALASIIGGRAKTPINLRIFDEPFANLSEGSMEKMVDVFRTLPGKTVIIEHNSVIKSIIDEVYAVELRNGVSRRV